MEIKNLFTFSWSLFHMDPAVVCFVVHQTENLQYNFLEFIDWKFGRLILTAYFPVVTSL